jgi:hypothetical protein
MIAVTQFFRQSNYIEAGVWASMGVLLATLGARWRLSIRTRIVLLVTLLAFGCSDVVEAHTGAWWDPWWLLVWKAVCVLVLLIVIGLSLRARRQVTVPQGD